MGICFITIFFSLLIYTMQKIKHSNGGSWLFLTSKETEKAPDPNPVECPPAVCPTVDCPSQPTQECPTEPPIECPTPPPVECATPAPAEECATPPSTLVSRLEGPVEQDDPELVEIVKGHLEPPSPHDVAYNFVDINPVSVSREKLLGQWGQVEKVEALFKGKQNGFFIEAGALDGERLSNTLLFELIHKWTGLLVEANPDTYATLRTKRRRAHSINSCLSPHPYPKKVQFELVDSGSGILGKDTHNPLQVNETSNRAQMVSSQCFPIYSILLALGNPTVDYFSLDVEGVEDGILESIPWDKVDIKVLTVEYAHTDTDTVNAVMKKANYTNPFNVEWDMVWVKGDFPL